jgi:WD40 repeat protein
LNDDYDYVRAIDFSSHTNSLYSCCDNGDVRRWDIELGKIVTQYSDNVRSIEFQLFLVKGIGQNLEWWFISDAEAIECDTHLYIMQSRWVYHCHRLY